MKKEMSASEKEAFYNPQLIGEYFTACKNIARYENYEPMYEFKKAHPAMFSHCQKVKRIRTEIKEDYEAMKMVCDKIYFGTLTFNDAKNKNKNETKRKEAFEKLKRIFKYVVLVEEYGGQRDRYHIHFLAAFSKDHNFQSFKSLWHSRQNLKECSDSKVASYIGSYLVKDLPRLHRNSSLCMLKKFYKKYKMWVRLNKTHSTEIELAIEQLLLAEDYDKFVEEYVLPLYDVDDVV